jgi:hypothetical protein
MPGRNATKQVMTCADEVLGKGRVADLELPVIVLPTGKRASR